MIALRNIFFGCIGLACLAVGTPAQAAETCHYRHHHGYYYYYHHHHHHYYHNHSGIRVIIH